MALKLVDGKLINEKEEKETITESPKTYTESPKNFTESPKNFTEPNVMSEYEQEYNEIQDAMNKNPSVGYDFGDIKEYGINNDNTNISVLYSQFKKYFQRIYGENELKDQFQKIEEFMSKKGTSIMMVNNTKPQQQENYYEEINNPSEEYERFKKFRNRFRKE